MSSLATTKMSSRGQVVIPEEIRKELNLDTGAQFIVLGEDGVVILKTIEKPALKDFSTLVKKARKESRAAGMKKSDISAAIKEARSDK